MLRCANPSPVQKCTILDKTLHYVSFSDNNLASVQRHRKLMDKETVTTWLRQHREILWDYGVKSLASFGSVARDEATENSDVDLLVEFEGTVTFDRYMDLKFFVEDKLGTSVDLVSLKMLKPQVREMVKREAIDVS